MDPLTEALRSVRLTGGVFLDARFAAPWCVTSEVTAEHCRRFLEQPRRLIAYHVVLNGQMLLFTGDQPPIEVRAGELVLLPHNDVHVLASARGLAPVLAKDLFRPSPSGGPDHVSYGGRGAETHIVCGILGSEQAFSPLLATLPKVLKLDIRQGTARDWIEASVRFAANELVAGRMASSGVMSRLSEVLLVEAIRQYAATHSDRSIGWARGFNDPYVGRALSLIHGDIQARWSVPALAKEVALSRSAFVERFVTLVGVPPIRYVTAWRLQTARERLRETSQTVSQVAQAVGYESEAAFSRAFKREFGHSPRQSRSRP